MKNTNLHFSETRVGKSLDLPQASHDSAVPYASTPGFEDDLHAGHGWIRSGPEIDPAAALSADLMVTNTLTTLSTVIGDDGNNTLPGTGDDDTMYGLGGNDTLLGYDGDDTLIGGAGDDVLVGDRGLDVAAYTEPMAGYVFSNPDSKVFRVTDTILANGDDGTDTLSGIETVRFSDGDIQVAQVGEFRVNTYTLGYQGDPVLARLSGGGFVAVWISTDQDGDENYGVYGQRYGAAGQALGGEFHVNTITAGLQTAATVAGLPGGGFVVTWVSDDFEIHGQLYGQDGATVGTEFSVRDGFNGDASPSVTALAGGGFVVTWLFISEAHVYIYGQRYTGAGTESGDQFVVTSHDYSDSQIWYFTPVVAGLDGGGFVVAWEAWPDGDKDIYARRYDSTGTPLGAEFIVNTYDANEQSNPAIAGLADGGFVVLWSSWGQDGSELGVYGQRYAANGSKAGGEFRVNTTTQYTQYQCAVAGLANGGFVAVWSSYGQPDDNMFGVYAQRYDAAGNKIGTEFLVNTFTSDDQWFPTVAATDDGGFVVSWQSDTQDDLDSWEPGIYAQRYDASGNPVNELILTGTSGADTLRVGTGTQIVKGGLGNDVYVIDSAADRVVENPLAGSDTVKSPVTYTLPANVENLILTGSLPINGTGNSLANVLTGNAAHNILTGNAGNDTLNGGSGPDTMKGGLGNDTYVVDNTGDIVTELPGQGDDLVKSGISHTLAANVENLTLTGTDAINGSGNTLDNAITGNSAANQLDGLAGADTLAGGDGNDIYVVDNTSDVVTELAGQGADLVQSSITHTLTANVEKLTLTGTTAINGSGNGLNNTLTGNSGANKLSGLSGNDRLNGGAGTDTMIGGTGNDTYVVDTTGDVVTELAGQGTDLVQSGITHTLAANVENLTLTGTAAINGTGNALDNVLTGNSAANQLDGLAGADTLAGGLGNDIYVVDNTGDVVTELLDQGTDLVKSGISHTLAANVENLTLTGTTAINGSGNALNNALTGNSAANQLDGLTGADTLTGGLGHDIYVVDNTGDVVTELAGQGVDLVQSGVTYTLTTNVEKLTLTGTAAINGTGNGANNTLTGNGAANKLTGLAGNDALVGNGGNDTLTGGAGNDALTGGAGSDFFVFNAALNATTNIDTLKDYTTAADTIRLENSIFTKLTTIGALSTANFKVGAAAADANDFIVYNNSTGALYYDADGSGATAAIQFATVYSSGTTPATLSATEFVVI